MDIQQGTPEWFQMRLGKVTASKVADVMSKGRGSAESAGVRNYRAQLVCERLTGAMEETYTNAAMQRGTELEPFARECYEFLKGVTVEQVAFIDHPTIPMAGASPDGLVGDDGLVEIKCPNTATHIDYLLGGEPPAQYIPQMTWQLACTGRKWVDFVSYDPRLPEEMQLFVVRFRRDDGEIQKMEAAVVAFNSSVDQMIADLRALRA
ncbi:YqaJ viral recombinase family protein [Oryzomonas sagensis]|uniref:YqaJ viral recombinase family protein n=1 Tax=Oryzomonas sagensis TaxID=2603857 RepID=A0ABQ6TL01_9BACT|nr:lambda exonuclease family protein [Oryzomonas sagensis]KAB0668967.1 YqaJ viral recombinase family protein [Oryzomonas sagensis]